ncbi:hypothetical protein J6590_038065 [Homalodisca vitripennis]|nr:hypothetical protein J6590_038065 [Homalodisca vitripennis]
MSHRKCFQDAAHNATPPPLMPITTHLRLIVSRWLSAAGSSASKQRLATRSHFAFNSPGSSSSMSSVGPRKRVIKQLLRMCVKELCQKMLNRKKRR